MSIQSRDGTTQTPATASVRLAPNVDDNSFLGAGSTIGVTFEVKAAGQVSEGPTAVTHTVTSEDRGFDRDVGGIPLGTAMWELCRKVIESSPQPVKCYPSEISKEKVEFRLQGDAANEAGIDVERVSLVDWSFIPIAPPVVLVADPGVSILQNAGTQEAPAVVMLSGTHWPEGASISLLLDTNIDDPIEFAISAEADDTAQILANKIAAFINRVPAWRAETTGGLVILFAVAPATVISVNAEAVMP